MKKSNGTLYWGSGPLAESDLSGTIQREYIFFNGKRVARRDVPGTPSVHFYFSDHLGSASVVTNASGTMSLCPAGNSPLNYTTIATGEEESDYYPYGGEMKLCDRAAQNYKFTGKERDTESGLDNFGARYHGSPLGRFMTPDPIAIMKQKFRDPQQWNMYAYTRNNPLRFMDPTGMYNTDCASKDIKKCSKEIQNLEANIRRDQKSKDPKVRAAAEAYGSFNDGNKVNVKFDPKAKAPGNGVQDRDANGKRLDSITITFQGMTQDSAGRALVAHEGSHVEDYQFFLQTGIRPSAYAGEMKAFETGAGVLLDQGSGSNLPIGNTRYAIERPDSDENKKSNTWTFNRLIDWIYILTPEDPTSFDWGKP